MPLYISKFRVFKKGCNRRTRTTKEVFLGGIYSEYIIAASKEEAAQLSEGPRRYHLAIEEVAEL